MQTVIREYDTRLDSKKRVTLRNVLFEYYHVREMENGTIIMEPRELTVPFQVSANTLTMMDESVRNIKAGKVSDKVDLSEFED
jgi:virulence-associated protein VapD